MKSKWKEKDKKTSRSPFEQKERSPFITVKTSLKSILKNYEVNFPRINQLVIECNEIVVRTYQLIRLYILHQYYQNEPVPHLDKDMILYFIRAGGVRSKQGAKASNRQLEEELDHFYETEFQPYLQKEKYNLVNKSYLTPYLAQQIQTGFNNNLKVHFLTRIRRFMNLTKPYELTTDDEKHVFNKVKTLILLDQHDKIPEQYKPWSQQIKDTYLPSTYEKCYGYDVKIYPEKYLFYTIKMNQVIEEQNAQIQQNNQLSEENKRIQTRRVFQPIPLRSTIIPSYVTLDVNVILSLFGEAGEKQMNQQTKLNRDYLWSKIFRTEKSVMKMKGYEYKTIQTDGIGVSICFQKIGRKYQHFDPINTEDNNTDPPYLDELSEEDLEKCKRRKLVADDPGKQSMAYMMDEDHKTLRYSVSQRRKESRSKRCRHISKHEKIINHVQEQESQLSDQNSKTVNYQKFKDYIRAKTQLNDRLKDFYQRELFRKMKWRTWIYRRKSEDMFLNQIEATYGKREEIMICHGNWSQTKQMKNTMPAMGIGLRRLIAKRFDLFLIDEFRTSKLCHLCHQELTKYKDPKHQSVYRLLVCPHCLSNGSESKNTYFFNRDANACRNFLYLSRSWMKNRIRPDAYCRKPDPDLQPQNVSLDG